MNSIGIDFGTSNSVAALYEGGKLQFAEFPDGRIGNPTVIYFPANRRDFYIGTHGIETYFDDLEHGVKDGRLMFSIKTLLPDEKFDHTLVAKHGRLTAAELCSRYLIKLKELAERQFDREFKRVVMGRPVDFSKLAVSRLKEAAKIAGFKSVDFVLEPLAAAAGYDPTSDTPELIFVVDLGGGTSDMCIVEVSPNARLRLSDPQAIKAVEGIRLAGDAISGRVFVEKLGPRFGSGSTYMSLGRELPFPEHIIQRLSHWSRINLLRAEGELRTIAEILAYSNRRDDIERLQALVREHLGYDVYKAVEAAKIDLSDREESTIRYSKLRLNEPITRPELEDLCSDIFESIRSSIIETCRIASISPAQIDKVLLTGGTSQIPYIQSAIENIFGPEKITRPGFFSSVASGLGHLAGTRH